MDVQWSLWKRAENSLKLSVAFYGFCHIVVSETEVVIFHKWRIILETCNGEKFEIIWNKCTIVSLEKTGKFVEIFKAFMVNYKMKIILRNWYTLEIFSDETTIIINY